MARDTADLGPQTARSAGLTYVNDHDPGLKRTINSHGVLYFDTAGHRLHDAETLKRIAHLVIPPAWTDVWICPDPDGHIQAVGRDARGRKQYRYHPDWRAERDRHKYERVCAFGRALPRLRRQVALDLGRRGLSRDKLLAAVVRLLEITLIRVGNDEYARTNKSFGLTTLRKRHMTLSRAGAVFEFRGKAGVSHRTGFRDRRLATVLKQCQHLPGQRLFQYVGEDGARRSIESADVNAYLRDAMGEDFSAKDFRTWAGTLAAARALTLSEAPTSAAEAKRTAATCVKAVAGLLGNTPTVCRACYIHPSVFDVFAEQRLSPKLAADSRQAELAMLELLQEAGAC